MPFEILWSLGERFCLRQRALFVEPVLPVERKQGLQHTHYPAETTSGYVGHIAACRAFFCDSQAEVDLPGEFIDQGAFECRREWVGTYF
jgi:hypothetical protein